MHAFSHSLVCRAWCLGMAQPTLKVLHVSLGTCSDRLHAVQSGQLGSVLFQFHSSFGPTATHRQHVEWCRRRLDARVAMSVEFRSRAWFDTETERQSTTVRFRTRLGSVPWRAVQNRPATAPLKSRVRRAEMPPVQAWLRGLGIALVAADELRHETLQPDRAQHGLPPGQEAELMPIALEVTQPAFFYVRVHRRCDA